ncbi:MAG: hypothetical protein ACRD04_03440 [Terriglobales bacterium]
MSDGPVVSAPALAAHLATAGLASILLSLFGGFWMLLALNTEGWVWLVACVLIPATLLIIRGIGLMMSGRETQGPAMSAEDLAVQRAVGRRLLWMVLIVAGIVVLTANLLASGGMTKWMFAVIALIVGVQFLFWPRLLKDPFYYATGGIEVVLCGILALLMHSHIERADAMFGLIMGLTLWLTVIFLLLRGRRVISLLTVAAEEASSR